MSDDYFEDISFDDSDDGDDGPLMDADEAQDAAVAAAEAADKAEAEAPVKDEDADELEESKPDDRAVKFKVDGKSKAAKEPETKEPAAKDEAKDAEKEEREADADGLLSKTVKVKIDGEESEINVKGLVEDYQRNGSGARRLQEAARVEQELQEREQGIKDLVSGLTPKTAFETIENLWTNHLRGQRSQARDTLREAATSFLEKIIAEDELSPEEKWQRRYDADMAEKEKIIEAERSQRLENEHATELQKRLVYGEPVMVEALNRYGIPRESEFGKEIEDALFKHCQAGEHVSKEIAELVVSRYHQKYSKLREAASADLDADTLMQQNPELVSKLIARHREQTLQARTTATGETTARASQPPSTAPRRRRSAPTNGHYDRFEDAVPDARKR